MTITSATETPTIISRVAGWLSPEEFHILEVACDTLLPSLEPPPGSSTALAAYYRRSGFSYSSVSNDQGVTPNWEFLDYPAPAPPPSDAPQPITPLAISRDTTLEADAVVVGSGAGGRVVGGELALAGKSVIVLEKGGYNNEANFTLQEAQATPELYLKRGTLTSKDLGVIVLAGSTL